MNNLVSDLPIVNACSNCKFWDTDEINGGFDTPGFGTCNTIEHNNQRIGYDHYLEQDKDERYRYPKEEIEKIKHYQATHKAATQDYENYCSWLITRYDFSCCLFEMAMPSGE